MAEQQLRFRKSNALGVGPHAEVFLALREDNGEKAVLSTLHASVVPNAQVASDWLTLVRRCKTLDHPGIARVVAAGRLGDGRLYNLREFFEGDSLANLLKARGTLSTAQVLHLGLALSDAMAYCHAAGVVHGDLRTRHIFLVDPVDELRVKIVDFGLALVRQPDPGDPYVAPEVRTGIACDERSDVYSIGAILFQALTGRVATPTRPPHDDTTRLPSVIHRALSEDRDDRFADAAELHKALSVLDAADRRKPSQPPARIRVVDTALTAEREKPSLPPPPKKPARKAAASAVELAASLTQPLPGALHTPPAGPAAPPPVAPPAPELGPELEDVIEDPEEVAPEPPPAPPAGELAAPAAPAAVVAAPPPPAAKPVQRRPESTIGDYELIAPLAQGRNHRVLLARHTRIGRPVVLRVVRLEPGWPLEVVEIARTALKALTLVRHENIVETLDFVDEPLPDGAHRVYWAMDQLEGTQLADLARHFPLPLPRVFEFAQQVCDALEAAHRSGVVHGRLTTRDVFVATEAGRREERVKLLGLGVSRVEELASSGGADDFHPDVASDIRAVGLLVLEVLAASPRPDGKLPPDAKGRVPTELAMVCLRAISGEETAPTSITELRELFSDAAASSHDHERAAAAKQLAEAVGAPSTEILTAPSATPLEVADPNAALVPSTGATKDPSIRLATIAQPPAAPANRMAVIVAIAFVVATFAFLAGRWSAPGPVAEAPHAAPVIAPPAPPPSKPAAPVDAAPMPAATVIPPAPAVAPVVPAPPKAAITPPPAAAPKVPAPPPPAPKVVPAPPAPAPKIEPKRPAEPVATNVVLSQSGGDDELPVKANKKSEKFVVVSAEGDPATVKLKGPGTVALRIRALSILSKVSGAVRVTRDGGAAGSNPYELQRDTAADADGEAVSKEKALHFVIPAGDHTFTIGVTSGPPVLVRASDVPKFDKALKGQPE